MRVGIGAAERAGEGRLKLLNDNRLTVRERSDAKPDSRRGDEVAEGDNGAGDEGRLVGRKKEGCLRACIIVRGKSLSLRVY